MLDQTNRSSSLALSTLYGVSKILASSLDLKKSLHDVLNVLTSYMDMRRCTICLLQDGGEIHIVASTGMTVEERARGKFRPGEGIVGQIFTTDVPVIIPDISKEPRFLNKTGAHIIADGETVTFIGVPIKANGRTVGVLGIDKVFGDRLGTDLDMTAQFLNMVANLVGQTVTLHEKVASEREFILEQSYKHKQTKVPEGDYDLDNVIGVSPPMRRVFAEVHQVAPSNATVLIRGESGTGKEVIARAVHENSQRAQGPFIKVNCAALPENLLESELFGHEKGAFTGAVNARKGRFEMADKGTLFLDEIGEISSAFQAKLLRVLQEREFERVGGNRTIKTDVRIVCATNKNLEHAVGQGLFRPDLYYRINVISIYLPPLRERPEDVGPLIEHFLHLHAKESGKKLRVTPAAVGVLQKCCWPGNVRELQNCVERQAALARTDVIDELDLACKQDKCFSNVLWEYQQRAAPPIPVVQPGHSAPTAPVMGAGVGAGNPAGVGAPMPMPPAAPPSQAGPLPTAPIPAMPAPASADALPDDAPEDARERLIWAMEKTGWVQAKAARLLNLTPRQVAYALKKHDIPMKRL